MQKHQTACVKRLVFVSTFLLAICFPVVSQERLEVGKGPVVVTPEMVEEGKRRAELLKNPYFLILQIGETLYSDTTEKVNNRSHKPEKELRFQLIVDNTSSEPLQITITDKYDQVRPQLFRNGEILAYKPKVAELVKIKDKELDVFRGCRFDYQGENQLWR